MLISNRIDQHTGQTSNPIVDQSYDLALDHSEECKRRDDEIL